MHQQFISKNNAVHREDSKLRQFSHPEILCAIGGEDVFWASEVIFQEA